MAALQQAVEGGLHHHDCEVRLVMRSPGVNAGTFDQCFPRQQFLTTVSDRGQQQVVRAETEDSNEDSNEVLTLFVDVDKLLFLNLEPSDAPA